MEASRGTSGEVFALTDEQIVGLSQEGDAPSAGASHDHANNETGEANERPASEGRRYIAEKSAQPGMAVPQEAPQWLAERMKDPWCGDQATQFWVATQKAERDAAAYRKVFATPEDARALKELYPGGVSEARSTAERAQALDEIDAAFYRGDSAARLALAQRMMIQDPVAFRAMVEAGVKLLDSAGNDNSRSDDSSASYSPPATRHSREEAVTPDQGTAVTHEALHAYSEFEKTANAELEKSVGAAINRAMEQALPNLRTMKVQGAQHNGEAAPLQERLAGAVREEVEAALKSDRQLGEQVARVLSGRRFDREARAQVVRLIDARAQQLVPGAAKRVVSSWTSATLAAKSKEAPTRNESADNTRSSPNSQKQPERANAARANSRGRRVDYGRLSDEQIVGL